MFYLFFVWVPSQLIFFVNDNSIGYGVRDSWDYFLLAIIALINMISRIICNFDC